MYLETRHFILGNCTMSIGYLNDNFFETPCKFSWNILETPSKHSGNTPENHETSLKFPLHWEFHETPLKLPWNALETSLKHPWNILETPFKLPWNTLWHSLMLYNIPNVLQTSKTLKEKKRDERTDKLSDIVSSWAARRS